MSVEFSDRRFGMAMIVPLIAVSLILVRLYYLQVVRGDHYVERSESNFIQERPITHSRGVIFDQANRPLADNRPSHDVYLTFALFPDSTRELKKLSREIKWSSKEIHRIDTRVHRAFEIGKRAPIGVYQLRKERSCRRVAQIIAKEKIRGLSVKKLIEQPFACQLWVDPRTFSSQDRAFVQLQSLLGVTSDEMKDLITSARRRAQGLARYKPTLFLADVPYDAYVRIRSAISLEEVPGVATFRSIRRRYLHNKFAAHLLGYTNEVSADELEQKQGAYRPGERIGRKGIEKVYESVLRGSDGAERFVVDAKGRRFSEEWERQLLGDDRITSPVPGNNLVLAVDKDMQDAAERAFKGLSGSVVALQVGTGFVLALASFPNYDPNQIVSRDNKAIMQQLSADRLKPWINKAIQEHYAPGSTFKAITAIAGFEHDVLSDHTHEFCPGVFNLGRAQWRCFKREGHGNIGLVEALKTSCDVFFYRLGYELGPDRLASTARLFGFGRRTGIDLDREIPGIMPDREYYVKQRGYYSPGLVINNSIGQGDVTATSLQLAVAYDTILNGGTIYQPQVVREVRDANGKTIDVRKPIEVAHLKEKAADLLLVKEGLSYVMAPGGTAYGLQFRQDLPELSKWVRESGIVIGGKTGTAQVVRLSKLIKHLRPEEVAYEQRDHAWFVAFAPADKPEVVVVVMTEHGGFGGSTSAPVAAEVIKTWFEKVRGKGRYAQGVANAPQQ